MAEILETFNFPEYVCRSTKYPWHEWTDGQIWKLKRGVDFDIEVSSMATNVRGRGKRCGKQVKTTGFGDCLVFQFSDKPADRPPQA